jgi:VanZ family protein
VRAFVGSSIKFLRNQWFIAAFGLVLLVASIDETNQSYVASRTGSIYDVLLDCAGGLTMILLSALYKFTTRR